MRLLYVRIRGASYSIQHERWCCAFLYHSWEACEHQGSRVPKPDSRTFVVEAYEPHKFGWLFLPWQEAAWGAQVEPQGDAWTGLVTAGAGLS